MSCLKHPCQVKLSFFFFFDKFFPLLNFVKQLTVGLVGREVFQKLSALSGVVFGLDFRFFLFFLLLFPLLSVFPLFIYFRIPRRCSGNLHELIFLNISTCKFFIASKYGDFCAFPPPPGNPFTGRQTFCLFVDPKMPFIDLTGRLFNFVFLLPTACEILFSPGKRNQSIKNLKKHRFLACLSGNIIIIIIIIITIIILLVLHDFVAVTSFN